MVSPSSRSALTVSRTSKESSDKPYGPDEPTPKSIYEKLSQFRVPFIQRAEEAAKYTIPALMPPVHSKGMSGYDQLYQPYQSLGSRGVNSLAANLLMTLLPPNQGFFRLIIAP